jgi:hypothetical protein
MGLDMYAKTTNQNISQVGFEYPEDSEQLYYWRKHPNLHGWMEQLYRKKGGTHEFNLEGVRLDLEDLVELEKLVCNNELPDTAGFFFGVSEPEDKDYDLEFLNLARNAIKEGKNVYYTSWW